MANQSPQSDQSNNGTRDLFLSYNGRDREAVVRLRELLQQRAIQTYFDRSDLIPGIPWQNELERAISGVRAVAVLIGNDGIGPWQRPEKELAIDRQVREEKAGRQFPVIPVLLPNADVEKVTGFLMRNTWVDLRGGLNDPAALDALARAVTGKPATADTSQREALCPYRGLEPFHEDDAPLFFGRDKFADDLLQKVLAHPLIAVVGPSGSGKSSVVQAGLLPRLRRETWPNKTWATVIFTPRDQPFHSLAKELLPLYETAKSKTDQMIEARTLGEALAAGTIPLDDPINAALKATQTANRLLLVVDQFEELFTLTQERYRQPFIESLIAAATRADSPVTVVLTLRADFYGQAIGLSRSLSDSIQQGLVNLGPMTKDELRQAIEAPAQRGGLSFEPGLVARLLDDVKGQPGNLPLLEFALKELWQRRQGGTITNEQYDAIGTLEGAISKRADAQFERVPPAERDAVLRAFTRLVRVSAASEEGTDTRQRVRLKDLDAAVHPIVRSFVTERLLVMSRDDETNEETVDVSHEALIRRWERLKELLNKDRQFLLWRQRLGLMLKEWQHAERDAGTLLRGVPLNEAQRWLKERGQDLNDSEREFIASSESAARQPRRWIAAGATVVVATVIATFGWGRWNNRDEIQISKILVNAPNVIKAAPVNDKSIAEWVRTLILTGKLNEALTATRSLNYEDAQFETMVNVITSLAEVNEYETARSVANDYLEAARKIKSTAARAQALARVVKALTNSGQVETSRLVGNEALEAARGVEKGFFHLEALVRIANVFSETRQIEAAQLATGLAIEAVQEVEDVTFRDIALDEVAQSLAKAGQIEGALEAAHKIQSSSSRSRTLSSIAEIMVKAGQIEAALKIEDADTHSMVLVRVVDALAKTGKIELAFEEMHKIKDGYHRSDALAKISLCLAKAGQSERATRAASEITYEFLRYEVTVSIVESLVKAGQISLGLNIARGIKSEEHRNRALVNIAAVMTQSGKPSNAKDVLDEAIRIAQQITSDHLRSAAFANIGKGLSKLRYYRLARELADQNNISSADKLTVYTAILREHYVERNASLAKLFEEEQRKED